MERDDGMPQPRNSVVVTSTQKGCFSRQSQSAWRESSGAYNEYMCLILQFY